MLTKGRFVKIHSLVSDKAKKHNGKTAIIKTPVDGDTGRCGVQPIGDPQNKILAIKPSNLTILCSFCKIKEEQSAPDEPIVCERCMEVWYCSQECKDKHWKGGNAESDVPNCHGEILLL